MKSEELIEKLNNLNKAYYTAKDIALITGSAIPVVRVLLNRLVKRGKLIRLQKNIYIIKNKLINNELIAQQINTSSYLSFESALNRAGILSQVPYAITLATTKRSKTITLGGQEVIFRKLKNNLFFGYYLENNLKIAYPEKAFLDTVYLISRGKSKANLAEFDLTKLNRARLKKFINKYPKKVKNICKKLNIL